MPIGGFPAAESLGRALPRMPFPGPETALPATIVPAYGVNLIADEIVRPGGFQGPSTTFQRLTRRLNDLRVYIRNGA
jgi:hypothetical protein